MKTIIHAQTEGIGAAKYRSDAEALAEAITELHQLDAYGLRRRWRGLVGGPMPRDLGRPLILQMLAYKLQAQRLGDLDKASQRELSALDGTSKGSGERRYGPQALVGRSGADGLAKAGSVKAKQAIAPPRLARPGTILTREYGGIMHRVMVLDEGVSWNGKVYDSLSKVALAITRTRWNGPRFFGLRDAPIDKPNSPRSAPIIGRRRAAQSGRSLSKRGSL